MSCGFSGSTSDRQAIVSSGIFEKIQPGQRKLADRGFRIADLHVIREKSVLYMPTFGYKEGRDQLTTQEAFMSRLIAAGRTHVERSQPLEGVRNFARLTLFSETRH
jgi:hypothetical protein